MSSGPTPSRHIICDSTAPTDPSAKPVRIYICVVGDLWHFGHANLCRQARVVFGNGNPHVIVGVCSDHDVLGYKRAPIMTAHERARNVAMCRYVDEVVVNCPFVLTEKFMVEHKIDLVVHGDDHSPASAAKYYQVALGRDAYRTVPYTQGVSTSELIKRIVEREDPAARKNPHGH